MKGLWKKGRGMVAVWGKRESSETRGTEVDIVHEVMHLSKYVEVWHGLKTNLDALV